MRFAGSMLPISRGVGIVARLNRILAAKGTIPWDQFHRMLGRYPLPPPVAIHSVCRPAAST